MRVSMPLALALLLLACAAPRAEALQMPRAHLEWRTLSTEHFDIHFPAELEAWSRETASRLEAIHQRVSALVGNAPGRRIDVVVEDPLNVSNGSAWATVDRAAMYLWPTPPEPRAGIGHHRGWPELLAVHEYAHLAHLTRPTRNPRQRLLQGLSPLGLGPLSRSPRWVTEGYATLIEGQLTGSGRPHGPFRAAVLRQWALEGKLPTFGQLNATEGFYAGSMAYLAGSAFLEWLVAERGDSSLVHLWRRMSARQKRSFEDAFAGVYGDNPRDLYDRFTVELTEQALRARRALTDAGVVVGDTVQALTWYTGDPALSADGEHIAIALASRDQPTRVVVWRREEEPDTLREARLRRMLERDPEDVAPVQGRPPAKKAVATLDALAGRGYAGPRFLPGGDSLLVTRSVPTADGAERRDLFVWRWKTGEVRRVTHGAALRDPDPAPDGTAAAAVRCLHGSCDLVRVDLATGAVTTLAPGSLDRVFYRPRWAPDGSAIVASVQEGGNWRLVRVDPRGGEPRPLSRADGASRYDAAWTADGVLVAVSEAGGVPNLVRVDPATGEERPLTRVTGAAFAPAPHPDGSIYFLALNPAGYALHRVHPDSTRPGPLAALPPALFPAAPRPADAPADTFARAALPPDRPYGLGPHRLRWVPGVAVTSEGEGATLALYSADPVGRFGALLQGSYGTAGIWRGGALSLAYRGTRPALAADLFGAEQRPSAQHGARTEALDARYAGAALWLGQRWATARGARTLRVGASAGALELPDLDGGRQLLAGEASWLARSTAGARILAAEAQLHGSGGRTAGAEWGRGLARLAITGRSGDRGVRLEGMLGGTTREAPLWERFAIGGAAPALFDAGLLSQRIAMPGLPVGTRVGERVVTARATLLMDGLSPFAWAASSGPGGGGCDRVVGVETVEASVPVPLLGIPAVQITGGVLYPLDEPFRRQFRGYLAVGFRP